MYVNCLLNFFPIPIIIELVKENKCWILNQNLNGVKLINITLKEGANNEYDNDKHTEEHTDHHSYPSRDHF